MRTVPLYLLTLIAAIANTPLNIFDVHAWNIGTVKVDPWRKRTSGAVTSIRRGLTWLHTVMFGRPQLLCAMACLLCLCLVGPSTLHASGVSIVLMGHINIDALERDLMKKSGEAAALLEKTMKDCQAHQEKDKEGKVVATGRLMTKEEKDAIQAILDQGKDIKAKLDAAKGDVNLSAEIEKLTAGMTDKPQQAGQKATATKSMGQQFIESKAFEWLKQTSGQRSSSSWTSPSAELMATTLDTSSGSGGPLIVTDYRPGILPLLFKRLVIADLIAPGTTDSNSITYMKETTFTNAAAPVAEGAAKPESALVFTQTSDPVSKIAHWLPVTEEMLEDVQQIRSYIDGRLRFGVALTEEDQLLNGSGTLPALRGILNRTGLTAAQLRGTDTNADAIFKQITTIATTVFVQPDGVVMNPTNWQTVQLMKDANGQYYGAGPFAPAQQATLWGLPVVKTPTIVAGTALVGAFQEASQIFRKGGLRVEASNSHNDFFIKNLVAIRAEERLALAVYRPAAFGTVTGLN